MYLYEKDLFFGSLVENKRKGLGLVIYKTGEILIGEFDGGLNGDCIIFYPNGCFMRAKMENDKVNGVCYIYLGNEAFLLKM